MNKTYTPQHLTNIYQFYDVLPLSHRATALHISSKELPTPPTEQEIYQKCRQLSAFIQSQRAAKSLQKSDEIDKLSTELTHLVHCHRGN